MEKRPQVDGMAKIIRLTDKSYGKKSQLKFFK